MADYQIVCTRKSPRTPAGHHHIVQVGLGSGNTYSSTLTVLQVYQYINAGNRFYTVSPSTGKTALVYAYTCCGIHTLRTGNDSVTDNNLDNLGNCN